MNGELLRLIESIHRDKNIDKEIILQGIEIALLAAARKHYQKSEIIEIKIDRATGQIFAHDSNGLIEPAVLGRIAAQTAKQVIIQKIKEAEGDVIYTDLENKQGDILTGTVLNFEHGNIVINIGRVEAVIPPSEQVTGESYRVGEHIKALVLSIKKYGSKVSIILSRTHPNFVRRLFGLEIPEIMDKIIEIKEIVREPGFRTKIAVYSNNPKVDAVGACVGVRGVRIKNIVEELSGEKIDIIKWDKNQENWIKNSVKPAEVQSVEIFPDVKKARLMIKPDQLSLAIGKGGQNIKLACRLTGWDIEVASTEESKTTETSPAESDQTPPSNNVSQKGEPELSAEGETQTNESA